MQRHVNTSRPKEIYVVVVVDFVRYFFFLFFPSFHTFPLGILSFLFWGRGGELPLRKNMVSAVCRGHLFSSHNEALSKGDTTDMKSG